MARPVVAAHECVQAIDAVPDEELIHAAVAQDYVNAIRELLTQPEDAARVGAAGRARVVAQYSWDAHLAGIDRYLPGANTKGACRAMDIKQ